MRIWTAHIRPSAAPVLVPEAFSWGAAIFGPLWLLTQRAWIAAVLVLCAQLAMGLLAPEWVQPVLALGAAWLLGLHGRDLARWSLQRRGFVLAHVVAARSEEDALARLLEHRPDLRAQAAA